MNGNDNKVQFQEYHVPRSSFEEKSKLVEWVVRYSGGSIKNEKQATYVLLGFAVLGIIISLFLFFEGKERKGQYPKDFINQPRFFLQQ